MRNLEQGLPDRGRVTAVGYANRHLDSSPLIAQGPVGHLAGYQARVGHDHLGPVNGLNGCRADTDALNGTLGAAYRVIDNGMTSIDLLAGECCFKLVVDFDAVVGGGKIKYSDSGDVLDGIIGAQVLTSLSERWYVSFYADVGGGDSKLTCRRGPGSATGLTILMRLRVTATSSGKLTTATLSKTRASAGPCSGSSSAFKKRDFHQDRQDQHLITTEINAAVRDGVHTLYSSAEL